MRLSSGFRATVQTVAMAPERMTIAPRTSVVGAAMPAERVATAIPPQTAATVFVATTVYVRALAARL